MNSIFLINRQLAKNHLCAFCPVYQHQHKNHFLIFSASILSFCPCGFFLKCLKQQKNAAMNRHKTMNAPKTIVHCSNGPNVELGTFSEVSNSSSKVLSSNVLFSICAKFLSIL